MYFILGYSYAYGALHHVLFLAIIPHVIIILIAEKVLQILIDIGLNRVGSEQILILGAGAAATLVDAIVEAMGTDALAAPVVEPAVTIGAHALALLPALVGAHARVHINHSAVDCLGPLTGQAGVVEAGAALLALLESGTHGNAYGGPLINILCGDGVKQLGQTLNIAYL